MKTLLFVTRNYPPAICGVGDHTHKLVEIFRQQGWNVVVFTGTVSCQQQVFSAANLFGKGIANELDRLIKKERVDTIFWQYVPYSYQQKGIPFWWPLTMRRLARPGLKQVIFFHEVSLRLWGYGMKQFVAALCQRLIANIAAGYAKAIFTSIPLYAGYFWFKKPVIVPISANIMLAPVRTAVRPGGRTGDSQGGVSGEWSLVSERVTQKLDLNSPQKSAVDRSRQPATSNQSSIFCFANRADEALLDAFELLDAKHHSVLILGGQISADKEAWLEKLVAEKKLAERVRFTGVLENHELADLIGNATLYMQPQVVERRTQGGISAKNGTIMAAMALGKPIITCRGDMTDSAIFCGNENMLFVTYGDSTSYRQALESLLANKDKREALGLAARKTYMECCSWEITGSIIQKHLA